MRACRLSLTSSLVASGSSLDQVVCDGSGRNTSAVVATGDRGGGDETFTRIPSSSRRPAQPLIAVLPAAIVALP